MLNTDNKNFKILALAISALIVGVEAQVTCTTSSPQCCWVVRSWQLLGKSIPTGIKSTDKSCCTKPLDGVYCDSTNTKVILIDWAFINLKGSIPSEIGKLTSLTEIYLYNNQLTGTIPSSIGNLVNLTLLSLGKNKLNGSIPAEIGNLKKLQYLSLFENQISGTIPSWIGNLKNLIFLQLYKNQLSGPIPLSIGNLITLETFSIYSNTGLYGTFIPNCNTAVSATNTSVILCGCATSGSPAGRFPPAGTSLECLSTGPGTTPLAKRALVFSQNIRVSDKDYKYTCNNDTFGNPYQDCLNAQGAICNTDYIGTNSTRIDNCKNSVDQMTRGLSVYWQNVRKSCGQWSFDGAIKGSSISSNCINANSALQQNAFYLFPDGTKSPVTSSLTNSVISGLWSKII